MSKVLITGEEGGVEAFVIVRVKDKGMCEHLAISGGYRANGGFGTVGYGVTVGKPGFLMLMLVLKVTPTISGKSLSGLHATNVNLWLYTAISLVKSVQRMIRFCH